MNLEGIKGHQRQIRNLEFLLKSDKIPQAILFTGISGIGKKLIAKRFLKALFCKDINPPCLSCSICKQIGHETFPDVIEIYPNEKGTIPIGGEDTRETGSVRWLIDRLAAKSISGKMGILIDGVDRISEEGQNALLKMIEEPSQGTSFLLITSNRNNLLQTILSRSSEIRFFPLPEADVKDILNKKDVSANNFDLVTKISGGSVEVAEVVADHDLFSKIIEVCKSLSLFIAENKMLDVDDWKIQNRIKIELLLDIMINIFRQNLLILIRQEKNVFNELKDCFINDEGKVLNLLKNLVLLKKSEAYNINFKYAVKGQLYS